MSYDVIVKKIEGKLNEEDLAAFRKELHGVLQAWDISIALASDPEWLAQMGLVTAEDQADALTADELATYLAARPAGEIVKAEPNELVRTETAPSTSGKHLIHCIGTETAPDSVLCTHCGTWATIDDAEVIHLSPMFAAFERAHDGCVDTRLFR
jgi:hypothetical protein